MKHVFVGLSGGVDSAVSAALLKERGLAVTGVFIKIWRPEFTACTWKEDRQDAMRVAVHLGIPFREIDLSDVYHKEVIERMLAAYAAGITPNPDVLCNKHVKFGSFLQWAVGMGADAVATGHYARVERSGGHWDLLRGSDAAKDQSYFLYELGQRELARSLFPVGALKKEDVRKLAQKLALPVARKPDSQGLCFAGEISLREFLSHFLELRGGPVLDMEGRRVGRHDGAALYTIGTRHGFAIEDDALRGRPCYVVAIDAAANTITVSSDKQAAARTRVPLRDACWVGAMPRLPLEADAEARYREKPARCTLSRDEHGTLIATFREPHIAAGGQALVAYEVGSERLIGGATIA